MGSFGESKENPVLQLKINGQVKSASSLSFAGKTESTDTLSFSVNNANWQEMELALNDASFKYDDTFRITARSAPNLSVLVINEGQPNPFIQAAFRAYNGFKLNQTDAGNAPTDWKDYNLVILNGTTRINTQLAKSLDAALQAGQSICVFPGKTSNFAAINEGLALFADIHITGIDTASQAASNIQQGSNLIKGLFEKIPDNVQLPVANWHYSIAAGLSANQQSILSFRNGDPFMAQYAPSKGQLYICATAADLQSGNFPGSYFFTPFLYEMAMQSGSSSIYAITAGQQQPIYLPLAGATGRNTIHVLGQGVDAIPPQKPDGAGIDIYLDQVVHQPGFYNLAAVGVGASTDTTKVALNQDKAESQLIYRDIKALQAEWKGDNIKWIDLTDGGSTVSGGSGTNFPIWKICILLAVVMLAAETYLLARPASLAGATGA